MAKIAQCEPGLRHTKIILPKMPCQRGYIRCDVDETMWPNAKDQVDYVTFYSFVAFSVCIFSIFPLIQLYSVTS